LGFIVNENGLISVDHSINDFGVTTTRGNPTHAKTHCVIPMPVHSIFLRHDRNKNSKYDKIPSKLIGDNCPFIYAVKKKVPNLFVNTQTIRDLCKPMNQILDAFVEKQSSDNIKYDFVIVIPSSHNISGILAKRIKNRLGIPLLNNLLRKSNSTDVFQQVNNDSSIPHSAKVNIMNAVKKSNTNKAPFSLSDVGTKYRSYVNPVASTKNVLLGSRVLLVDDLFATGTTLITARDVLLASNPNLIIDSLCLFSPLNGRIRKAKQKR
jgi:predicted amidophosphoribosyltransferase